MYTDFEKAEIAKFIQSDVDGYEINLKIFRDDKAEYDYARNTVDDEGKTGRTIEIAKAHKASGVSVEIIKMITDLSDNERIKL